MWPEKSSMRDPLGDGNVLYLDWVNINILVVILLLLFHRMLVTIRGNWIKGTWYLSALFLQPHVNL